MAVANLYKNRWQIELFFKWMKQHLNIQRFWGETVSLVLTEKIHLKDLLCKSNDNIINELDGSSEPNLFNF